MLVLGADMAGSVTGRACATALQSAAGQLGLRRLATRTTALPVQALDAPRCGHRPCSRCSTRSLHGAVESSTDDADTAVAAKLTESAKLARELRRQLNTRIVGHSDAKEALLLALLSHEHVLLEGPSGIAKTQLAEEFAQAAGASPLTVQFQRDTRSEDLISSGSVLRREQLPGGGEAIRSVAQPGGVLAADVCVLDDVGRAPGEVLSALLRALAQRRTGLRVAIATTSSASSGHGAGWAPHASHADTLDPAFIDRFALQVRLTGALHGRRWRQAARLVGRRGGSPGMAGNLRRSGGGAAAAAASAGAGDPLLQSCAAELVWVPPDVRRLLLRAVQALAKLCSKAAAAASSAPSPQAAPAAAAAAFVLSDRTFLVKAVRVLRARAALEGRPRCVPADLRALRHLTAFRVPASVHDRIEELLDRLIAAHGEDEAARQPPPPPARPDWSSEQGTEPGGEQEDEDGGSPDSGGKTQQEETEELSAEEGGRLQAPDRGVDARQAEPAEVPIAADGSRGYDDDEEELEQDSESKGLKGQGPRVVSMSKKAGDDFLSAEGLEIPEEPLQAKMDALDIDSMSVQNIEMLLAHLVGNIDRGRSELAENPGGSPRRWRAWDPRDPSELSELDPLDLHRWAGDPSPAAWPRARQRMKRDRGGQLAVLRDVSMSMAGVHATWSTRVALGLLEAAERRGMHVGYIEFNHQAKKFYDRGGTFFSEDYEPLSELAMNLNCSGWTNYEQPLEDVLREFERLGRRGGAAGSSRMSQAQRHVLLITDGVPTHGDPHVEHQRLRALELGVVVHSVYLGWPATYPKALERLSTSTGGTQFAAFFEREARSRASRPAAGAEGPSAERPAAREPRARAPVGVGLDSGFIRVVER